MFEEAGGVEVVGVASHDGGGGGAAPRPSSLPQSLAPRARASDPPFWSPAKGVFDARYYSSERAWIHEKRGPPGGGLFQQLGVFFTFRGPQNNPIFELSQV